MDDKSSQMEAHIRTSAFYSQPIQG